ncbi:MAG: lipocalin family protein [Brumimicrobium sp.]
MKTIKLMSLAVLATVFLLGSSCSKYEEGPAFSLRTKKARLAGEWKADKYVSPDGEESNADGDDGTMEFEKDGTVTYSYDGFSVSGEWEFTKSKEYLEIELEFFGQTDTQEMKILKLKNDELWLEDEDGSQMHYVPA